MQEFFLTLPAKLEDGERNGKEKDSVQNASI